MDHRAPGSSRPAGRRLEPHVRWARAPGAKYLIARLVLFVAGRRRARFLGAGRVVALFGGLLISLLLTYLFLRPAARAGDGGDRRTGGGPRRRAARAREDEDALSRTRLVGTRS